MAGLTGNDLLNRIKELGDINKEDLIAACGYGDDSTAFYEAVLESQGISLEAADPEQVNKNITTIGNLGYRWLYYQFAIDNGLDDDKLVAQQDEFKETLKSAATELVVGVGKQKAGVIGQDLLGVLTYLFATLTTNRFDKRLGWTEENPPTEEQKHKKHLEILEWAENAEAIELVRGITDIGYSPEEVKKYQEFRNPHYATIATYLRTVCLDWAYDTNKADVESFASGLQDAKAYLAMLNEGCDLTIDGIRFAAMSALQYDLRCEKPIEDSIRFLLTVLDEWIEDGNAILSEHRKSK